MDAIAFWDGERVLGLPMKSVFSLLFLRFESNMVYNCNSLISFAKVAVFFAFSFFFPPHTLLTKWQTREHEMLQSTSCRLMMIITIMTISTISSKSKTKKK
ncbi:hypothetical protein L228DRAFT_102244 [Xylona heveae TC161]|uniref:Uncharacterized protein n=1 Tax=Xylona heveae (strain CBS 132557 / TC161) TaxID=1328760 RepID=A0A165IBV8_XYLHT|nr:hypothetical protein L228DRAFT_102244 [Xylona heveae TC161]KZF24684.1 hypothetical protein L228DRAFT_102244 [Xylona heveae TC161]